MKFINNLLNDTTRALLIAFFPDLVNLAVSLGLDISSETQTVLVSAFGKGIVLLFYIVKTGQGNPPPPPSLTIGEDQSDAAPGPAAAAIRRRRDK